MPYIAKSSERGRPCYSANEQTFPKSSFEELLFLGGLDVYRSYSGYESHAPFKDFFPFRKLRFGGRQSNVSMTITASRASRTIILVSILGVSTY